MPLAVALASNCVRYCERFDKVCSLISDASVRSSSHSGTCRAAASRLILIAQSSLSSRSSWTVSARNFSAFFAWSTGLLIETLHLVLLRGDRREYLVFACVHILEGASGRTCPRRKSRRATP